MPKPGQLSCRPDTLIGPWMIEPQAFSDLYSRALAIIDAGQLEATTKMSQAQVEAQLEEPYTVDADGIAHVLVRGPLTQYPSSMQSAMGGTSMLVASRAIREAADSDQVRGILMEVNSPGGTAAGAHDFASAIQYARAKKPVHAHTPGTAASGGYFVGIEADRFTADPMAVVGSVGAITQLRDTSELMRRAGITNYYPASGDRKATGAAGVPVTTEQIADMQSMITDLAAPFVKNVATRRGISSESMKDISRAGLYVASKAQALGMVDAVCTMDEARTQLLNRIAGGNGPVSVQHNPAVNGDTFMSLTNEQIAQAKTLPGCASITQENAAASLLSAAISLQNVANDATTQANATTAQLATANGKIASLQQQISGNAAATPRELATCQREARTALAQISGTKISPACADAFAEAFIGKEGEPVVTALSPDAQGVSMASKFIAVLAKNEGVIAANGKQQTNAQPVARTAPGSDTKTDADLMAEARAEGTAYQTSQLQARGLNGAHAG